MGIIREMRSRTGAILLIVVGALLLLTNLGMIDLGAIRTLLKQWWPVILIGLGVSQLIRK